MPSYRLALREGRGGGVKGLYFPGLFQFPVIGFKASTAHSSCFRGFGAQTRLVCDNDFVKIVSVPANRQSAESLTFRSEISNEIAGVPPSALFH
jgi:hypothetical protein